VYVPSSLSSTEIVLPPAVGVSSGKIYRRERLALRAYALSARAADMVAMVWLQAYHIAAARVQRVAVLVVGLDVQGRF